jgi:hypothetical protein
MPYKIKRYGRIYSQVLHNDILVNDRPHIKIILPTDIIAVLVCENTHHYIHSVMKSPNNGLLRTVVKHHICVNGKQNLWKSTILLLASYTFFQRCLTDVLACTCEYHACVCTHIQHILCFAFLTEQTILQNFPFNASFF